MELFNTYCERSIYRSPKFIDFVSFYWSQSNSDLVNWVKTMGYDTEETLFAISACSDEINWVNKYK
jgi:hypothetical protein